MRRLWLSLAMLGVGAALMVAAQLAGAAPARRGGIFTVGTTGASVQVDPQLSYIRTAWWLEYATAAKLVNWSDDPGPGGPRLVPEVASRIKVSSGGRRYTFTIRKGFRFSDGAPVTAANFDYAIDRLANHELDSTGAVWITGGLGTADRTGPEIVGAAAVKRGEANHVRGVRVHGNKLVIDLVKPDGSFLTILTMPFFQATSTKLPLTKEVVDVRSAGDLPSAGPYTFTRNDVDVRTSLRRNPFWKPGPGRHRPRNLQGVDLRWNLDEDSAYEQVLANRLDEGPIPYAHTKELANRFGVNRSRFWLKSVNCVGYVLFNMREGLLAGNAAMRRAVSWAIDRTDYAGLLDLYASPWTHLLPPGTPGAITKKALQPYGPRSNIPKAKELAAGHFRDGKVTIAYLSSGSVGPGHAAIVRRDLIRIGFDPANITMKGFSGSFYIYPPLHGWDLAATYGWCSDKPDPYDFFRAFIVPSWPQDEPFLTSPKYVARIENAAALTGSARVRAFGRLDLDLTTKVAPAAFMQLYNQPYLFSDRVDPRSLVYSAAYNDWSIPALALK